MPGLATLILLLLSVGMAAAQAEVWPPPTNISNTSLISQAPVIAADYSGRVHVIWGENLSGEARANPDTAFYSTLIDGAWSPPVDVIAVASGNYLSPAALAVDPFGRLVFVYTRNGGLSVSIAPVEAAGTARGWVTIDLETTSRINSASLAIGRFGEYHLVYIRNEREVIYVRSADGGMNWSTPALVASAELGTRAVISPHVAVDDRGGVYVTWTQTAEEISWSPIGIWFARSPDEGMTWDTPQEMVGGPGNGSSTLLFMEPDTVHLFWIGSGGTRGRYHRYSLDRGVTWSNTITALSTDLTGFAGRGYLLLASDNVLHVVVPGADAERNSIWHSTWNGSGWAAPRRISGDLPDSEGAYATIGQGHVLHVVWNELQGGEIWYTSLDTGSSAVVLQVQPTPTTANIAIVMPPTATPSAMSTPSRTEPQIQAFAQDISTIPRTSNSTSALLIGVVPAALLVIVVVLLKARR